MLRALFVAALLASGCFEALPLQVKTEEMAAQLNRGALRPKKLVVSGGAVSIRPHTAIRFCRSDGTRTPWVEAGEVWISEGGLFVWRTLQLSAIARLRMEQVDATTAALVPQTAPTEVSLAWSGKDSVEAAGPAGWAPGLVLAVAREKWASHRGLSERWFNDRALKHLKQDLHGASLGRWSFWTPRGWTNPIAGEALLQTVEHGVPFADGLRWQDVCGVEVWNEAENAANTALWLMGSALMAAAAVMAVPAALALGRGAGGSVGELALHIPAAGEPGPKVVPSTGDTLWSPSLPLPEIAGARTLLAGKRP